VRRLRMRELDEAAHKGDLAAVRVALDLGANVNEPGDCCRTPLHKAALKGHAEIAEMLLERRANVHARDMFGNTPLLLALGVEMMRLLLDHGSDPLAVNAEGGTVLMNAGVAGMAARLLEAGCDPNATSPHNTPLYAATFANAGLLQLLLDRGADPSLPTLQVGSPLDNAAKCQKREMVDLLVKYGARHTLCTLAYLGEVGAICARVAAGAPVDERNHWNSTPLHCAAQNGHLSVAALLLDHGADLDAQDDGEFTPLLCAINCRRHAMAEFFIERGADVSAKDHRGEGTLHWGLRRGDLDLLRLLLRSGATTWDEHLLKYLEKILAEDED